MRNTALLTSLGTVILTAACTQPDLAAEQQHKALIIKANDLNLRILNLKTDAGVLLSCFNDLCLSILK
ncbi:MAG: hypothetical protein H6573_35635, partial [Lewinellaceae bacterium]|nr:hypothetical protein [Lewinellaceae bacterium]